MDKRLELIDALLLLSKHCERVARLLETNILNELPPETELAQLNTLVNLDLRQFELWPPADPTLTGEPLHWQTIAKQQANSIGFDLSNSKILEYSIGPSIPIGQVFNNTEVDLVCNTFKFGSDEAPVRIINSLEEAKDQYDIGVVYESLEFATAPILTLLTMKRKIRPGGKIFIRFRPWSSRDGGFQSSYFNKAFAHLFMDLEASNLVQNKVVRPLAIYESMLNKAGLTVLSRKVNTTQPDDFIINNAEYMSVLINRTWGTIKPEDAVRIMTTTTIDFMVLV